MARFANDALDLDDAVADLGHFQREEFLHQIRVRPRTNDQDLLALLLNLHDVRAEAVSGAVLLAEHLFLLGRYRLGATQVNDDRALFETQHGSGHQRVDFGFVLTENHVAFGFSDPLDHDLLGRLRGNAAELGRIDPAAVFVGLQVAGNAVDLDGQFTVGSPTLAGGR